MGKSKKPRKRYRPKVAAVNIFKQVDIDDVRDRLRRVELTARMKLGFGTCTLEEMREIRDLFNGVVFAVMHRSKAITDSESAECIGILTDAGACVAEVCRKGFEVDRYVCTGYQLKTILEGLRIAGDFVKDALDIGAAVFLNEFNGSLLIRDAVNECKRFTVDKRIVDAAYIEAIHLNRMRTPHEFDRMHEKIRVRLISMINAINRENREEKMDKMLTSAQVAEIFGIKHRTVYTWVRTGKLSAPDRISQRYSRFPLSRVKADYQRLFGRSLEEKSE